MLRERDVIENKGGVQRLAGFTECRLTTLNSNVSGFRLGVNERNERLGAITAGESRYDLLWMISFLRCCLKPRSPCRECGGFGLCPLCNGQPLTIGCKCLQFLTI